MGVASEGDTRQHMGCESKRASKKPKPGRFRCGNCGVVRKSKKNLCAPKKIKKKGSET
jgi:hypothetical protein